MKISCCSNINQTKYNQKINVYDPTNKTICKNNISFGSLILSLAAKGGLEAIKNGPKSLNLAKILNEVDPIFDSPHRYLSQLPDALSAIAKIPDNASEGLTYSVASLLSGRDFVGTEVDVIGIRNRGLDCLPHLEDSSHTNIQIKKDYLLAWLSNSRPIAECFVRPFSELSDNHYMAFKQEVIDKALFSKEYAQRIASAGYTNLGEQAMYKVEMVESLNRQAHSRYLRKVQPTVDSLKDKWFRDGEWKHYEWS